MRVAILDLDIPVYHCGQACEDEEDWETVTNTVDLYLQGWLSKAGATHYVGYLTDSPKNYRNILGVTWPYKGHRKATSKPQYYQRIRDYMVEHWGAQVLSGIEADDGLAIAQGFFKSRGIQSVIVTEDKDLLQVPGLHYNVNKSDKVFEISEEQGDRNLWLQVITGDKTDNIPGVSHAISESLTGTYNAWLQTVPWDGRRPYRKYPLQELYGPKSAEKYLEEYPLEQWPSKVLELYIEKYEDEEEDEGYGALRFQETFDLIYMLRTSKEAEQWLDEELDFKPKEVPVPKGVASMFKVYED